MNWKASSGISDIGKKEKQRFRATTGNSWIQFLNLNQCTGNAQARMRKMFVSSMINKWVQNVSLTQFPVEFVLIYLSYEKLGKMDKERFSFIFIGHIQGCVHEWHSTGPPSWRPYLCPNTYNTCRNISFLSQKPFFTSSVEGPCCQCNHEGSSRHQECIAIKLW